MDRIVVVQNGNVVEDGSHETLLEKPDSLYKKLWDLQAGGFIVEE
jgi:ABC-type multidrug transport system fused ATPase/permease subunit